MKKLRSLDPPNRLALPDYIGKRLVVVVLELAPRRPIPVVRHRRRQQGPEGEPEAPRPSAVGAGSVVVAAAAVDSLLQDVEDTVEGDIDDEGAHTDVAPDVVHHRAALRPAASTNTIT